MPRAVLIDVSDNENFTHRVNYRESQDIKGISFMKRDEYKLTIVPHYLTTKKGKDIPYHKIRYTAEVYLSKSGFKAYFLIRFKKSK